MCQPVSNFKKRDALLESGRSRSVFIVVICTCTWGASAEFDTAWAGRATTSSNGIAIINRKLGMQNKWYSSTVGHSTPDNGLSRMGQGTLLQSLPHRRRLHFQIVASVGSHSGATALGQQIAAQKGLQIAVQHLVHVAYFDFGAVVLGHAIGL